MRQIVLDTETTGLEVSQGHRIIEIGCVEIVDRKLTGNHYHQYVKPERAIDQGALEVHGISEEFLADKPAFARVADDFLEFIRGAELVIHNAPFDVGFIDAELKLWNPQHQSVLEICQVTDSLQLARNKHRGSAIASMHCVSAMRSTIAIEHCTAHYSMQKFLPMSIC